MNAEKCMLICQQLGAYMLGFSPVNKTLLPASSGWGMGPDCFGHLHICQTNKLSCCFSTVEPFEVVWAPDQNDYVPHSDQNEVPKIPPR